MGSWWGLGAARGPGSAYPSSQSGWIQPPGFFLATATPHPGAAVLGAPLCQAGCGQNRSGEPGELLPLLGGVAGAVPAAVAPGRGDVPAGPLAPEGAGLGARPEIPGGEGTGGVVTPGSGTSSSVRRLWRGGRTGVPARCPRSRLCLALCQGRWHPAGPRHCW